MVERPPSSAVETASLSLSPVEQWTLHQVLLDSLRREVTAFDGAQRADLRRAFETADGGGDAYTHTQLEAMQRALARVHHTRRWEVERPQLEGLLHRVSVALETEG